MTEGTPRASARAFVFTSIALVSCSMLMYEILLTRICALRLYYHYGFLVVSNCLLMIGASGSLISVLQEKFRKHERVWIRNFGFLYAVSLIFTYGFLVTVTTAPGINFLSFNDVVWFSVFNLAASVPFFFAGCVIGLILTFAVEKVNKVYALDLVGAGLGCLLSPLLLWYAGAGGCFVAITAIAVGGTIAAISPRRRVLRLGSAAVVCLLGLLLIPRLDGWFPVPSKPELYYTPNVAYHQKEERLYSRWSAISRVDLLGIPRSARFILGRGAKRMTAPLPDMKFIVQDGSAGTIIAKWAETPQSLEVIRKTLYGVPTMLKKNPRVFVIGVGGGNDLWAAKLQGARYVKGIELNQQIVDLHHGVCADYSKPITDDPTIEIVCDEGRSALMRDTSKYDIIQMSGIDTWTSLTSGAYVLAENYLYTVEAVHTMYDRLADDGILSIALFGTIGPLRLLVNASDFLETSGQRHLENSVVCLSCDSKQIAQLLLKKGEFTTAELAAIDAYTEQEGIDIVYHPHKTVGYAMEEYLRSPDRRRFIDDFPLNISSTPDDRPYFYNSLRWDKPFAARDFLRDPIAMHGNPFFIFIQLLISTFFAVVLIVLPVLVFRRRGVKRTHLGRFLVYFMCLGLGFIAIEIAVMQKLVLFLGHPLYSVTVTLFAMLVFTGLGSFVSERWFPPPTARVWVVPVALGVLLILFVLLSPKMVAAWIVWPKAARILVTTAILAPLGLLLGVPFAYGMRLLNQHNPTTVPWAWAVNGCMTVVGSILTVILSMRFGFNFVLFGAMLTYFAAFLALLGIRSRACDAVAKM